MTKENIYRMRESFIVCCLRVCVRECAAWKVEACADSLRTMELFMLREL